MSVSKITKADTEEDFKGILELLISGRTLLSQTAWSARESLDLAKLISTNC